MLTLGDIPPPDPTLPEVAAPVNVTHEIRVRALTTWNAILVGVISGFSVAIGTFLFERAARRTGWKSR